MAKRALAPVFVLTQLMLIALGCNNSQPTTVETGSVRGHVYIHFSDQGIAGAVVQCAGRTATTDSDGKFFFESIPAGDVEISVSADGFLNNSESVMLNDFLTHNIMMTPVHAFSSVSGYIRHRNRDTAIQNAEVALGDSLTSTNLLGYFEFSEFPHGEYTMNITHDQYNTDSYSISMYLEDHDFSRYLTMDDSMYVEITADTYYHTEHADSLNSNFSDRLLVYIDDLITDDKNKFYTGGCRRIALVQTPTITLPNASDWAEIKRCEIFVCLRSAAQLLGCGQTINVEFQIRPILTYWWEALVEYSNPPAYGSILASYTGDDAIVLENNVPRWFSIDITEQVRNGDNYGVGFFPVEAQCNRFCFVSSENTNRSEERPYLKVVFEF